MATHTQRAQRPVEPDRSVRYLQGQRSELSLRPLPRQLTRFVGRAHEVDELCDLVTRHRLVVLTGAGGCGKTRLALEVAEQLRGRFHDGVLLVELASLGTGDIVASALAEQFGVATGAGDDPLDALVGVVGDKRMLLVLDNCEHVVAAASSAAATLVDGCPNLAVVATSRQDLDVPGAAVWLVPPLATTNDQPASEAVELFADRAALASRTFALTDANRDVVHDICERLDGLPFAIELAASRIPTLGPRQILERVEDRFGLLGGHSDGQGRHDTLGTLVDWSYELLDGRAQALLRRLSVFAGSFDLDAAEAVTAGDGLDRPVVVDGLGDLVRRSLVTADEVDGRARYRLLRTIADYAREQLSAAGDEERWRERHLQWCLAASDPGPNPAGAGLAPWVHRMGQRLDDVRRAIGFSLETARDAAALALAWRTTMLSLIDGPGADTRELLDTALARTSGAVSRDRALGLLYAGECREVAADPAAALVYYRQTLALGRALDDPMIIGMALWYLGDTAASQDDPTEAERHYHDSLDAFGRIEAPGEIATVQDRLAGVMLQRGDIDEARALLEAAVDTLRRTGSHGLGPALGALAAVEACDGNDTECRALLETALVEVRREDYGLGKLCASLNLGDHIRHREGVAAALPYYREGLSLARTIGNHRLVLRAIDGIAVAAAVDEPEVALRLFAAVDALSERGAPSDFPFKEVGAVLAPQLRAARDAVSERLTATLGEPRTTTLVRQGQHLSLDEAAAEAWAVTEPVPDVPVAADDVGQRVSDRAADADDPTALVRLGDVWRFDFSGRSVTVSDAKGVGYLARLLARPGDELHVLDLSMPATSRTTMSTDPDAPTRRGPGDAGAAIDEVARRRYQQRVDDLRARIDDATAHGDGETAALAQDELDAVAHELAAAYGLGGRPRTAADPAERARKAVTKCIRTSITHIARDHRGLGRHLDAAVRTGTYCAYDPPQPVTWTVVDHPAG